MTAPLPRWVMLRYAKMWEHFGSRQFSYDDVSSLLKEKNLLSVFLSELRKAGWLEVTLNPEDSRKRLYRLINPEKAVKEIAQR